MYSNGYQQNLRTREWQLFQAHFIIFMYTVVLNLHRE